MAEPKRRANAEPNPLHGQQGGERHDLVLKRERDMIELRFAGASLASVAEHFGVAESTASGIIKRGLLRMKRERVELRELELGRLDRIVRAYWEDALGIAGVTPDGKPIPRKKDHKAAAVVVNAIRERVKIGQLDTIDDDGPSETPRERADRVAEQLSTYLAGVRDGAQQPANGNGKTT